MTPLGMAFLDNAGNWLSECPEGRVQCLQVARKRANQITVHYTVDVMSLVAGRRLGKDARIGIAHTNIRCTSRYDRESVFESCALKTIELI